MAKEILVIDLSDIRAFRLRCENCKSEVVQEILMGEGKAPDRCPVCSVGWFSRDASGMPDLNYKLMMAFFQMRKSDEPLPMTIQLEIDSDN